MSAKKMALFDATEFSPLRVFVTSCSHAPEEIWRDYNRRADSENRIAGLKHDLEFLQHHFSKMGHRELLSL